MAVTGGHMRVIYRYTYLGQKCENIQYFRLTGTAFATASVLGVLEALWNDVKSAWHSVMSDNEAINLLGSIVGDEIGGGLGFAEFAVPPDEQVGTRHTTDLNVWLNSFSAIGARLTVGTRATRPGQKRFPFLQEGDIVQNALTTDIIDQYDALFDKFSTPITLGSPVATGVMQPEIGKSVASGFPTVFQDVTGKIVNGNLTSQISRKVGRGS